jgi:hypothetical protein
MAEVNRDTGLATNIDYGLVPADLQRRVEADLALTIEGVGDSAGYKICDTRRKEWVKVRTSIDKRRKEFNAAARDHIRRVDAVAAELTEIAGRAEDHCCSEVDRIDAEIESARQAKLDAAYRLKNERLLAAGVTLDRFVVDSLSDEQIDQQIELSRLRLAEADRQAKAKAESDRLAAEQSEANRKEAERLAADRKEFEQQRREQEAAHQVSREQQAVQQRLIDEANEKLRKAEADQLEKINRKRREAEAAEAARQQAVNDAQAKAEADLRAEALRPLKVRLIEFAYSVENLEPPDFTHPNYSVDRISSCLRVAALEIKAIADSL